MYLRALLHLGILSVFALLVSCASAPPVTKSAQNYLKDGEAAYAAGHYEDAIVQFKKVRESYTSPELSTLADLKIADAHFDHKAFIEAAAAYDDFRKLHPTHEKSAYALYRLSLSHYNQISGIDTDQTPVKNAVLTMESFLSRYPDSEHAGEVRLKLAECRNKQLEYENYVGDFYLRTGKYSSAIKRLNEALAKFTGSPKLDQTLFSLGKAYLKSGDAAQGKKTLKRLSTEFPASPLNREAAKLTGGFAGYSSFRG
jgi:outer membrane protein assembly factor BamD